ncbi:MAG: DUF58 domain-containing protein [Crocinitomicaceae bacterium]|jgi:uncharacterized protein (DUF58 family)|nr:DUF58 domain-containing protein [Crocinitomicaceae bacterium]
MTTKELLEKIKKLEIRTKHLTKQVLSGEYHSAFKGRGMTFSEVRNYQLGDEIRTIDWNVSARFNEPYVKVFEEERELQIALLLDLSASIDTGLGQKSKRELMAEIAAILSFSAVENKDKVSAYFYTDMLEKYIPPATGRKHNLYLLRELLECTPKHQKTDFASAANAVARLSKKKAIVFVISDFKESDYMDQLRQLRKKHELICIKIHDEMDRSFPEIGLVPILNPETGRETWVNTNSEEFKSQYQLQADQHSLRWKSDMIKLGIDAVEIGTDEDGHRALVELFHKRRRIA